MDLLNRHNRMSVGHNALVDLLSAKRRVANILDCPEGNLSLERREMQKLYDSIDKAIETAENYVAKLWTKEA